MKVFETDLSKTKFYHYYPCLPCVVVVKHGEKLNGMSVAWNTGLSFEPPLFGVSISPKRFTYSLIKEAKEFTANFLSFKDIKIIAGFGRISGRNIDKFKTFKAEIENSKFISTPILKNAYASYECKVIDIIKTGDHDLFVGKILGIHYDEELFEKETKIPNMEKIQLALYLGADFYISPTNFKKIKIGEKEVLEL
ncbi:MAG: flavin reductase family protein [Candidatus Aenigmatarchaeota archaeon]